MAKKRRFTDQADGNDTSKMPRTGVSDGKGGVVPRGRKPKTGELINMGDPRNDGYDRPTRKQPKGWMILNVLPFGKKHKP